MPGIDSLMYVLAVQSFASVYLTCHSTLSGSMTSEWQSLYQAREKNGKWHLANLVK